MRRLVAPCTALAVAFGVLSPLCPLPTASAATPEFGASSRIAGGGNGWSGPATRARLSSPGRVGIDTAPDGSILVTQDTHVLRVRPDTDTVEVVAGVGSAGSGAALSGVRDVAARGLDVVVATDAGVLQVTADGTRTSLWSSTTVQALDVGADGAIWVAQIGNVLRISPDGTVTDVTPGLPFGRLLDIAVSPDGAKAFVIDNGKDRWGIYAVTVAGVGARVAGTGQQGGSLAEGTPATSAAMADALSLTTDGTVVTVAVHSEQMVVSFTAGGNIRRLSTNTPCSGGIDRLGTGFAVMCGLYQGPRSVNRLSSAGVDQGRLFGADPTRPWSPDGVLAADAFLDPVRGAAGRVDGRVVFTTAAGLVREVDAAGRLKTRATLAPFRTGGKVAVGPNGTAYVVSDAGAIESVTASGATATVSIDAVASDIEVRSNGRLVVADKRAHRLLEADPDGGAVSVLTNAIGAPSDIGLDGDDVLVADNGLRRVGPGGAVTTLLTGGAPTAAAAGADGVWTGALHAPDTDFMVLLPTGALSPVRAAHSSPFFSSFRATIQADAAGSVLMSDGDVVTRVNDAGLASAAPALTNLVATPGSGRVVLTWDDVFNPYGAGRLVRAKRGASAPVDMWDGEQVASDPNVFRVGNELLKPGEQWTFAVFAMDYQTVGGNQVTGAWSPAAVSSAAADLDSTPPPPPVQPKLYASHTSVAFSWSNPIGDDFDHSVARMSLGTTAPQTPDQGVAIGSSEPGSLQTAAISSPVKGQEYAVSIFTVDIHGLYSVWNSASHLDFDAPGKVTGVAVTPSYFNASATFTPPVEADYDGVIYAFVEGDATPPVPSGPALTGRQLYVGPLKMGTNYTLAIWSHDAAGNLSAPQLTHFTTLLDPDPPSPVTDLTATGGDWQITTSWKPPVDSDLKDVELLLFDNTSGKPVRTLMASATDTSRIWGALPGGHSFTVTATARDLRLNRSAPITTSATTLPDANGRPPAIALADIRLTPISSTRVTVSFPRPNIPDLAGIWWGLVPLGQPTAGVPLEGQFSVYWPTVSKTITLPEPLTSYQLVMMVADFSHGTQTVMADIHGVANAAELPGAPTSLTVTSPVDNVLEVRFGRPSTSNARPTSWLVTATSGSSVRTQTIAVNPDGSPAFGGTRFVELLGRLTWSVSVVGVNALGHGPQGVVAGVFVADNAPPAPRGVLATAGNAQAMVSWIVPASNGGSSISSYQVTATPGGRTATTTGAVTKATVTGLTNGTSYTFKVTATNPFGTSPPSAPSAPITPKHPLDFTGDGKSDVLAVKTNGDLLLYRGNGAGGWAAPGVKIGAGWGIYSKVFSPGDFTGDGKSDVMAVKANGDLLLYRGNGAGGWAAPGVKIGAGWGIYSKAFSPGDFTGDGKSDVMAVTPGGDFYLYRSNGTGGWGAARVKIGAGWNIYSKVLSPGDFTGDGKPDVMAIKPNGDLVLYRGNGAGGWGAAGVKIGAGWGIYSKVFSPGDFTGDGKPDVMAVKGNGDLVLYHGNGAGGWGAPGVKIGAGWGVFSQVF